VNGEKHAPAADRPPPIPDLVDVSDRLRDQASALRARAKDALDRALKAMERADEVERRAAELLGLVAPDERAPYPNR
jgi:hypothetical protein